MTLTFMQHAGFRAGIEIQKYRRDRKCEEIAISLYDVPKEKQFITATGVFETNMHLRPGSEKNGNSAV